MRDLSDSLSTYLSDKTVCESTNNKVCQEENDYLVEVYLKWLAESRRRSALTVMQYGGKLRSLVEFLDDTPLGRADVSDLELWLGRPRQNRAVDRKAKAATLSRDATVVKGLYRFLHERGLIRKNPSMLLVSPTVHNDNPRAIDDDIWQALWFDRGVNDDERVMLGLGYFCGLRRMEMVGLKRSHLKSGVMSGFIGKGGYVRTVPYKSCVQVFAERAPHLIGDPKLFLGPLSKMKGDYILPWAKWARGGVMNPDQVTRRLTRLLDRQGTPEAFTPHALRHSFVTKLLNPCNIPIHIVSRLAGHRDISITMRYVKTAVDPLAEFLSPPDNMLTSQQPTNSERNFGD